MQLFSIVTTIPNGQSVTPVIDLQTARLVGISFPAAWTAADLSFQTITFPDTVATPVYQDLYDDTGTLITIKAAAGRNVVFTNPGLFLGIKSLIIRSGTTAVPVAQGAARDLVLLMVP